jgi:transposase-like protein
MNIIELFQSFQTQEQSIEYLEKVRWHGEPCCPYCGSFNVGRHASPDRAMPRWQCRDCSRAFAVTIGTLFHGTHVPLRDWFLVLALMLNAKKSASAYQIARDIGKRRATVWTMMQRIRTAMAADPEQERLLHGIVEADETWVGGKPRKRNRREDRPEGGSSPRGRATDKPAVMGAVERGGRVVAKMASPADLNSKGIAKFISRFVSKEGTLLITDEFPAYRLVGREMLHAVINHSVMYADGDRHTNTIEGFWSLVKRAWYGSHHHYSRKYMPLYIAEACYKYNRRKDGDSFGESVAMFVGGRA